MELKEPWYTISSIFGMIVTRETDDTAMSHRGCHNGIAFQEAKNTQKCTKGIVRSRML